MSDSSIRRRTVSLAAAPEGRARGYISTYEQPYEFAPRQREVIERGAFDLSKPIPVFYQHDHNSPPVGTATLSDDDTGVVADVAYFMDTDRGRAAYNAVAAGAMNEWSVGFIVRSADDMVTTRDADGTTDRIKRGDLAEVSQVLRGANPNTSTLEVRADGLSDSHEEPLQSNADHLSAAMAVMDAAIAQLNAAHGVLSAARKGTALPAPATDDDDGDSDDGGQVADPLDDPSMDTGAALRAANAADRAWIIAELTGRLHEPHIRAILATLLH